MLVANSFDLWQKDTFFSAAEEVQQSTDIMESAYRTRLNARKEALMTPQCLDELSRQLQMALGTAKWQLEEFERAVNRSHRNNGDEATITRHKQFVSAIRDQILRVEADLKDSLNAERKKPFRWVNLDEEECDDLAHFLSATPGTSKRTGVEKTQLRVGSSSTIATANNDNYNEHCSSVNNHARCEDIGFETDRATSNRRTCNSSEKSALEIIIDSDDIREITIVEATPKEKGSKPFFWRSRGENHPGAKAILSHIHFNVISWINHHLRGSHKSQIQQLQQVSLPSLPACSMRFVLVLLLTIFLVVPFLMYSTGSMQENKL